MRAPGKREPFFPYYELHLSLRYLRSRFSSVAALLSVTFGVAVILIVLSIMGGYMLVLRQIIRGQESDIIVGSFPFGVTDVVELEERIRGVENVEATAPFIETLAMYRSGRFNPCQLRGISPAKQVLVSSLGQYVLRPAELDRVLADLEIGAPAGAAVSAGLPPPPRRQPTRRIDETLFDPAREALRPEEVEHFFDADFGRDLLQKRNPSMIAALAGEVPSPALVGIHMLLDQQVFLGQIITIVTVKPGESEPIEEMLLVAGAFKTGDYEADSQAMYVDVDMLKNLLGLFDPELNSYRYSGVRVKVKDSSRTDETVLKIREALEPDRFDLLVCRSEQLKSTLLQAVAIEKFVIYFLLVLLMSFTGCMVLLMLLLTVIEKTRDMGILLALGATPRGVTRIFLLNGLAICLAGTALGLALGYLFSWNINPIHDWIYALTGRELFAARIYHMDRIPIVFQPGDVFLSIGPPIVLGFLSSLVPAIWASRRDPIKAIHYE